MRLHILGVNGPFPESHGATSGYLLEAGGSLLQFDLGSGVLARLTALTPPEDLTALFISHWHFDHAADVPVLMYRLEALQRTLKVFAPADESSALYRLVSSAACFSLTEIVPGQSIAFGGAEVTVTSARHPVPTVGFRVTCESKAFGYTGDTNTLPSLAQDYRGCGLLLADGLFPEAAWSENKPHLSAKLAASLAEDAGVPRLFLTHLNPLFPPSLLLEQAREVHTDTQLAAPGMMIDI